MLIKSFKITVFMFIPILVGLAQLANNRIRIPASDTKYSRNVTTVDDHVALWGMGRNRYTWVAVPRSRAPFTTFSVQAEVRADTADGHWPILGVAFNDSSNLKTQKQLTSVDWHTLSLGSFTPGENDSLIFFVFTNDYYNRETQQDLNLRIRQIEFREIELKPITLSWNSNPEPDLAGYRISYGIQSGRYTETLDVGNIIKKILILPNNSLYYFVLTAYDKNDNESLFSEEVAFQFENPPDEDPILPPSINCDINADGQMDLRDWLAFRASLHSVKGDARFKENADLNKDEKVDDLDEKIINTTCLSQWGLTVK